MKVKTPAEMTAYAEGFVACYEQFCKYLNEKDVREAVSLMTIWKDGVNKAVEEAKENDG